MGICRSILLELESNLGRKINRRERIVAFIPKYSAYLTNRYKTGSDGKVVYQRQKGKNPRPTGLEFGEKVLYIKRKGDKFEKLNPRLGEGIFVGVDSRSQEHYISRPEGIVRAECVYRIPESRRWGEDCVNWVKWAPWNRYAGDEFAEGDVPDGGP